MSISIVFLTFNCEKTILRSVDAALQVSNDVHAVDSFSTDRTVELLRQRDVTVTSHPFEHYGAQRNWAIANLPLKHGWELHLDADEELTPELIAELKAIKNRLPEDIDGYFVPRLPSFLGRRIYHGGMYPIWHMRLFRRGKGHCEERKYDQHFYVDGKTDRLKGPMIDYVCDSLSEWVNRHNRWADAEVEELFSGERHGRIQGVASGNPVEQKRFWRGLYDRFPLFVRPVLLFFYRFVFRMGFLDGIEGFIFFVLKDFWFRFLVDAKTFERQLRN